MELNSSNLIGSHVKNKSQKEKKNLNLKHAQLNYMTQWSLARYLCTMHKVIGQLLYSANPLSWMDNAFALLQYELDWWFPAIESILSALLFLM